jgi:ABC-2 type transport system ATP-binding protein
MIIFDSVTKEYSKKVVLSPFSYKLEEGRSMAILGPNGAGKTTLIRMALGVIPPTHGSVRIWDQEICNSSFALKRKIGVVLEEQNFLLDISATEYLRFFAELYEVKNPNFRITSLLDYMELGDAASRKIRTFSTGMKRKLNIIQAVLHNPNILIVDELFSGLDPIGISLTMKLLREMKQKGTTLILSSHILSDLDELVDDLLILDRGEVKAVGKKEELWASFEIDRIGRAQVMETQVPLFKKVLMDLSVSDIRVQSNNAVEFVVPQDNPDFKELLAGKVLDAQIILISLSYFDPRIQQLYTQVMNYKEVGDHAI